MMIKSNHDDALVFKCEQCQAKLKAKVSSINKKGRCPECDTIIVIKDNWEED